MAKKSQAVIDLETELRQTKEDLHNVTRMAAAYMPGSKAEIKKFGAKSNSCSVDLILSNGCSGKKLLEPTAVIYDHTFDYPIFECVSASRLRDEAHKPLGQYATKEDHSRRDVCDKAFSWLLQHEREEQAN